MAYIFKEENFKSYLRRNATRSWFSKRVDNAKYSSGGTTYNVEQCSKKHTVRVKDILRFPSRNLELAAAGATLATGMTGFGLGIGLAPFTFGASLLVGAAASAGTVGSAAIIDNAGRPGNVYFVITGDNSEWVAEKVETDGMWGLANNICKWSNEIYQEKFETYAYQEQPPKW